jgi:hypothetical protein
MREGTTEKAKKLVSEAEEGSAFDREISLDLAMGLFEYKGDKQGAEEVLAKISEKFKDENTMEAVRCVKSRLIKDAEPDKPVAENLEKTGEDLSVGVFPNPANASVKIRYGLKNSGHVSIVIYNVLGQKIRTILDKEMEAGGYEADWNGMDINGKMVSSGVYLCRLEAAGRMKTIKVLMTK